MSQIVFLSLPPKIASGYWVGRVMRAETAKIQEVIDFCLRARSDMGQQCHFRTRTLLDMLLLELGKELARSMTQHGPGTDRRD